MLGKEARLRNRQAELRQFSPRFCTALDKLSPRSVGDERKPKAVRMGCDPFMSPGGMLRLCLPDAGKAIDAYLKQDREYFMVPDEDYSSLGGKFVAHILWYGHSRVMYTQDFIEELLYKAGFAQVHLVEYRSSRSSLPGITDLDNRPRESLFVEAVKETES